MDLERLVRVIQSIIGSLDTLELEVCLVNSVLKDGVNSFDAAINLTFLTFINIGENIDEKTQILELLANRNISVVQDVPPSNNHQFLVIYSINTDVGNLSIL